MIELDSLVGHEFQVEINGHIVTGVFRVDDFAPFKLDATTGERLHPPFKLVKMVQRDGNNTFNRWLREAVASSATKPHRDVTIKAVDDGVEMRTWTAKNAWISDVHYHVFDSASSEMVAEIVTIHYESIEYGWPATPTIE